MATTEPRNKTVRNALGLFEALRRLGFTADEIFFLAGTDAGTRRETLYVQIRAQNLIFTIYVGDAPKTSVLEKGFAWWNDTGVNPARKTHLYETCALLQDGKAIQLVAQLLAKGFHVPVQSTSDPALDIN